MILVDLYQSIVDTLVQLFVSCPFVVIALLRSDSIGNPGFPVEVGGVGEPHAAFFMKAAHAHPIGKPDWSQLDPLFVAAGSAKKWVQLCVYAGFFFARMGFAGREDGTVPGPVWT